MTVEEQTPSDIVNANGTGPYQFDFQIYENADLEVVYLDAENNETPLTLDVDYTVSGAGAVAGGTITTTTDYGSTGRIRMTLDLAIEQEVDLRENEGLLAEVVERMCDRLTKILQQVNQSGVSRAIRSSVSVDDDPNLEFTELAAERAGKIIIFSGDGSAIILGEPLAGSVILDEDDMASNSSSQAASQQSIVAYIAERFTTAVLTMAGKTLTTPTITNPTVTGGGTFASPTLNSPVLNLADLRSLIGGSDAAGDILFRNGTKYVRLAKGTALQLLRMNAGATAPEWATQLFSPGYTSPDQTITAAGALVLAHGLGATPNFVQARIKCTDAGGDAGYSQNDEVIVDNHGMDPGLSASAGQSMVVGETNIDVRFGSNANVYKILNKGTGSYIGLTASKWVFIVRAWL